MKLRLRPGRFGRMPGAAVAFLSICAAAWAVPLNVPSGTQLTIYPGQVFDSATVQSNGTLIMNGGAIGTNVSPSITVLPGGRFYMNDGRIRSFDNRGVAEFYGGAQSTDSSENRGHVKFAGGDPGIQLVHYTGTVDVYYLATNRTVWEIYSVTTSGAPVIRFFSLTNTLAAGAYTYATLPSSPIPPGRVHTNHALLWNPASNRSVRTDVLIATNWPGSVVVQVYAPLSPIAITCRVSQAATLQLGWNSVSGRTYQIEDALSLPYQDWMPSGRPVVAVGSDSSIGLSGLFSNIFYRLKLRH